ncbi:MAG TPA: hypothetical protein VN767_04405 [Streptosporangiaceae bacterium]|nr:hypothetical protein [Streptosporangiaceae bacterium]
MEPSGRDLLGRIVEQAGGQAVLEALAEQLSGADLTSLLLEVMRRRAERVTPADVLRRYTGDRFVRPSDLDLRELRRVEDAMFGALPAEFDVLTLAPVVPLGTHSSVATVDPRKVIATVRRTEVAADPTNALALEAAVRRRRLVSTSPLERPEIVVRLATSQRVTRAALFSGPVSFSHFQLFGLVTAGRDIGGHWFERRALLEHLRIGAVGLRAAGADSITLAMTSLDGVGERWLADVRQEFSDWPCVTVVDAPEREAGRGYYQRVCFKIFAGFGEGEPMEIADGGFVDWTAQLLGSRKERLLISGHGLDRLAIMTRQRPGG